jgi:hypothetical protein
MLLDKIRLLMLVICFVLMCTTVVLNVLGLILPLELVGASEEKPIVVVRKTDIICAGVQQMISDDESIYLLFGQYGVVQAYSYDGRYKYSISVYDHLNGRTKIASDGEILYVCDKVGNIYSFSDGVFIKFTDRHESESIKKKIRFGVSDPNLFLRSGSVWHVAEDGAEKCVVPRAAWLVIYQNDALTALLFLLIVLSGMILHMPRILKQTN